jgi:ABC-type oligopeptide transport system substrate-binding subunit
MARTGDHRKGACRPSVLLTAVIAVAATLALTGCPKKGATQRAGEKLDAAKDKVSDTLNPKGPAEKAGRSIDRATGN